MKGFLSTYKNDFVILNKEGMSYLKLDDRQRRSSTLRSDGLQSMIHSISSSDYLKIEKTNMINFECEHPKEK